MYKTKVLVDHEKGTVATMSFEQIDAYSVEPSTPHKRLEIYQCAEGEPRPMHSIPNIEKYGIEEPIGHVFEENSPQDTAEWRDELRKSTLASQAFVKSRLFELQVWLADKTTFDVIFSKFLELGLICQLSGPNETQLDYEVTLLGSVLDFDMMMAMAGMYQGSHVLRVLYERDFLTEEEASKIIDDAKMGVDLETTLKQLVQRVYYEHYNIVPGSDEDPLKPLGKSDAAPTDAVNAPPLH
jgi:hypothetical protein